MNALDTRKGKNWAQENRGFFFVLPWVLGFLIFTMVPMLIAVYISLTDWSILGDAYFIGIENFREIFKDPQFVNALSVTVRYAVVAVPMTIAIAVVVAISLNYTSRTVNVFRVVFYLPAIVSGVSVAIVFKWILEPQFGLLNSLLNLVGIQGPDWLYSPPWVLPSYWVMAAWGAGSGYLTYLAALKDVPQELYESAKLDGANFFQRSFKITLPLLTPIIFYNMVMGLIGAFRKFSDAYIMEGAGEEGTFYMVYLYKRAFSFYEMGYATALAWILFVIILSLTGIVNLTRKYWVYSEE